MNLRNTVTDLRSLLGRSLDEDDVKQNELPHLLYQVEAAEDGTIAARVRPTLRRLLERGQAKVPAAGLIIDHREWRCVHRCSLHTRSTTRARSVSFR